MYSRFKTNQMRKRITPNNIAELAPNQRFVFGSNLSGIHGAGAASLAYNSFGAEWGVGEGLTGNCYAFPTKAHDVKTPLTYNQLKGKMPAFWAAVDENKDLDFMVTQVGTGYARFSHTKVALLFAPALFRDNVFLTRKWWGILALACQNQGLIK